MPLAATYNDAEVVLGPYRLPIKGRVQVTKAVQHPGKVTIGKTSRSDQVLADEWIQEDWREGMLIQQMDEQTHRGRFWYSTVDTLRRRKMVLPPDVTTLARPSPDPGADPEYLALFQSANTSFVVASYGGKMYRYVDDTWEDLGNDSTPDILPLPDVPSSHALFKRKLFLALDDHYVVYDPIGVPHWTKVEEGCSLIVPFDVNPTQKLVKLYDAGSGLYTLAASADGTASSWTTELGGSIEDVTPTGLIVYRNAQDEPTLYLATTTGLYSVDIWTKTIYPTGLQILHNAQAGKGLCVWSDGNLYFSDGLAVWRYPKMGQIANLGLDMDEGLPSWMKGKITTLTPNPNFLVANIDVMQSASVEESVEMGVGWVGNTVTFPRATVSGNSYLMAFNGMGWHTLYVSPYANSFGRGIANLLLTTVYNDERRLFFTDGPDIKYVLFPEGNYDPVTDENATYAPSGEFWTSWYDGNYSETEKLALELRTRTLKITGKEYIDVYYGLNDREDWYHLGTIYNNQEDPTLTGRDYDVDYGGKFTVGQSTVDADGHTVFVFDPATDSDPFGGTPFYSIRFKFVLYRRTVQENDDPKPPNRYTPVLLFFDLCHKLIPDTLFGWTFTVTETDQRKLFDLWVAVQDLARRKQVVQFGFETDDSTKRMVEIAGVTGIRFTGKERNASFTLTVVELINT
jgi:hypothetical protein